MDARSRTGLLAALAVVLLALPAGSVMAQVSGEVSNTTIRDREIQNARVRDTTIIDSTVRDARLTDSRILRTDLERVSMVGVELVDSRTERASIRNAQVEGGRITAASLRNVDVRGTNMERIRMEDGTMRGGSLRDATVVDATLDNVDRTRVSLCRVRILDEGRYVTSGCPDGDGRDRDGRDRDGRDRDGRDRDGRDRDGRDRDGRDGFGRGGRFAFYDVDVRDARRSIRQDLDADFARERGFGQRGTCEGFELVSRGDRTVRRSVDRDLDRGPPRVTTNVRVGDTVRVPYLGEDCQPRSMDAQVVGRSLRQTQRDGRTVDVLVWIGRGLDGDGSFAWDARTGLLVDWQVRADGLRSRGSLDNTNARLATR